MHKSPFFALLILAGTGLGAAAALAGSNIANDSSGKTVSNSCPPANWTALDVDHDGYATKDEVKRVAPCIDFDAVDANVDGSISRVEFLDFQEARTNGQSQNGTENGPEKNASQNTGTAGGGECPADKWTALDLDHDGYATKDEVKKAAPCIDFDAVDTNGDGSISRVEFLSFQEAKAQGTSAGKTQGTGDESMASQNQAQDTQEQESTRQQGETSGEKIDQSQYDTPKALVSNVPKGELKNPFKPHNKAIAKEGHQLFLSRGCSGCHGGGGGGGMAPPLTDQTWSFGDKPDTLYRLVILGSKQLQAKYDYSRNIMQTMRADMPGLGASFDNTEDLWKIITWIESKHLQN